MEDNKNYDYVAQAMVDGKSLGEILIEVRKSTGMSRQEFCKYFGIPYRTLQDWELGNRVMPEYLLRLMAYKVRMENLVKEGDTNGEQKKG